jgi:hypothetical protein
MTTKPETIKIVDRVLANWPSDPSLAARKTMYETWHRLIGDLSYEDCAVALDAIAVEDNPWPPRPGTLRKRVVDLNDPIGKAPAPSEAWVQFRANAVAAVNGNDLVPMHPLVRDVVVKLGITTENSLHTNGDRDVFIRAYEQMLAVRDADRYGVKR